MTADKVTLRMNAVVTFKVADALRAVTTVEDHRQALYREAQLARIAEALADMPEKYRAVIDLYYFKDKSYQEISEALGLPMNTVKVHLLRAKEQLRKKLGAESETF